jgi:hypothetical protein
VGESRQGRATCAQRSPRPAVFSHLRPGTATDADRPSPRSAHWGQISELLFYLIFQYSLSPWLSTSPLSRRSYTSSIPPPDLTHPGNRAGSSREYLFTSRETYPPPPLRLERCPVAALRQFGPSSDTSGRVALHPQLVLPRPQWFFEWAEPHAHEGFDVVIWGT